MRVAETLGNLGNGAVERVRSPRGLGLRGGDAKGIAERRDGTLQLRELSLEARDVLRGRAGGVRAPRGMRAAVPVRRLPGARDGDERDDA